MKHYHRFFAIFLCLFITTALWADKGEKSDWPGWLGPERNGFSTEKILTSWPESGPKEVWRKELGAGFSAFSVEGDRLYTMYADGKDEYTACLNAATGAEIWRTRTGAHYQERVGGDGPRTTPAVDGDLVYSLSAYGDFYAMNKSDGSIVWQRSFSDEYGAAMPRWGFSCSPLVYKNMVLMETSSKSNYSAVAFDKKTGKELWHASSDKIGYSSPIITKLAGTEQALFFTGTKLVSLSPDDGTIYWQYPWITDYDVNSATPVVVPGDRVFISSDYGVGGIMLQVKKEGSNFSVEKIWKNREMKNHMATSLYYEGHIYGFDSGTLKCIDAKTGEGKWRKRGFGKGTLIFADGHFIVLGDAGDLALIEATPAAYREKANAGKVIKGRSWTNPVLANGKLYLRNLKEAVCLDITP